MAKTEEKRNHQARSLDQFEINREIMILACQIYYLLYIYYYYLDKIPHQRFLQIILCLPPRLNQTGAMVVIAERPIPESRLF